MRLRCLVVESSLQTCYIAYWNRTAHSGYLCLKRIPLCLKVYLCVAVVNLIVVQLPDVVIIYLTKRR